MARAGLIFAIACGATLLSAMSGGSSSLLTTPTWIALGVPLPVAIGTDKIAGTFWTLVGARNYLRGRPVDWPLLAGMIGVGVIMAALGATVTTSLDPTGLKRAVEAVMVVVVVGLAVRPAFGATETTPRLARRPTVLLAAPLGFYEGLLGSGNSIATTLLLCFGRGFDLLRALGHYYLMAAAWCGVAAVSYAAQGAFDPGLAVPATAGAVTGGYLGSRLGRRFGTRVVRGIFLLAGTILATKLLVGR